MTGPGDRDAVTDGRRMKAVLVLAAALAFAASPLMTPDFGGFRPDQFPVPQDNPPVQPAGWAFAIWGLIYAWLLAGAAYGLFRRSDDAGWDAMRTALIVSLVVGTAWLPTAQASVPMAVLLIWIMLGTALAALRRAGRADRWWQRAPVAVYAGWLTAASSVSVGLVLAGWGLTGPTTAALLALALALAIAVTVQRRCAGTPEYAGAVIWALVGVVVANLSPLNLPVAGLALAGAALLAWRAWRG